MQDRQSSCLRECAVGLFQCSALAEAHFHPLPFSGPAWCFQENPVATAQGTHTHFSHTDLTLPGAPALLHTHSTAAAHSLLTLPLKDPHPSLENQAQVQWFPTERSGWISHFTSSVLSLKRAGSHRTAAVAWFSPAASKTTAWAGLSESTSETSSKVLRWPPCLASKAGLLAEGQRWSGSAGKHLAWRWEAKPPQRHQIERLPDAELRKREEKAASFPQDGEGKRTIVS